MANIERLQVYRKTLTLTVEIYTITKRLPGDERFGLTSQMRRAAVSIGANLSEGSVRATNRDQARYCEIAIGSAHELIHYLRLCRALGYVETEKVSLLKEKTVEITKMLKGLIRFYRLPTTDHGSVLDYRPST